MKFTNDNPVVLKDVRPAAGNLGPVALSNHSRFGFNIRHFYVHWQTGEFRPTKKGVSIMPADVPLFLKELETFINDNEVVKGGITITINKEAQ